MVLCASPSTPAPYRVGSLSGSCRLSLGGAGGFNYMLTINLSLCLHNLQSHRTRLGGCCRVRCGCIEHPYLKKALAGHVRCVWSQCLQGNRVCTEAVEVPNTCSSKSLSFYGKAYHTCNNQQHASEALRPPPCFSTTRYGDSP